MKIVAKNFPFSKEICKFEKGKNFRFGNCFFRNPGYKKPASSAILFPLSVTLSKKVEYIKNLIERTLDKNSAEISEKAFDEMRNFDNLSLLPSVFEFIEKEPEIKKRQNAYILVFNFALKNKNNSDAVQFLIHRLEKEKDKTLIESILWDLSFLEKNNVKDLTPIFKIINSKKTKIRRKAISALNNSNDNESEKHLLNILENSSYYYDLYYAMVAFHPNSQNSLKKLEKFLEYPKEDIQNIALHKFVEFGGKDYLPLFRIKFLNGKSKFAALEGLIKYGDKNEIPIIERRIKQILSKKRKVEVVGKFGYTEIISAMEFIQKLSKKDDFNRIYSYLLTKKEMLWKSEVDWLTKIESN